VFNARAMNVGNFTAIDFGMVSRLKQHLPLLTAMKITGWAHLI
jgi:hypothetical protein